MRRVGSIEETRYGMLAWIFRSWKTLAARMMGLYFVCCGHLEMNYRQSLSSVFIVYHSIQMA